MAESLRRLVNTGSFNVLQDKTERWLDSYHVNTCDQNVTRCCEIIELNSRVQAQLFKVLSLSSSEGGLYGGAGIIKSRLLPWLGSGLFAASAFSADTTFNFIAESAAKDRELNEVQDMYERNILALEQDLTDSRVEADELKSELNETRDELDDAKRVSTSEKMFSETERSDLMRKLRAAEDELITLRARVGLVDQYQREVRHLRDDISILSGRKDVALNGDIDPLPLSVKPYRYLPLPRPSTPFATDDITQRIRQSNLVSRFNDMYSQDRLDAMDTLRRYSDEHENNQRILCIAVQEAFSAAKLAFSSFKLKVRANLVSTHLGPETLEEAVQDYINRNTDLYDLPGLVSDVTRALNRNPRIYLPIEVTYSIIQPFIREACKLAWNMSALAHPLDIALATDAELMNEEKYRRSYDSEFSAPLVSHHIWPCLQQGLKVLVKGEAVTRRGASLTPKMARGRSRSPSPIRSRSISPTRSFSRARSRSPSPRRMESSLSGRASPGPRSLSRASSIPSRAVTASTSLSHYGVRS